MTFVDEPELIEATSASGEALEALDTADRDETAIDDDAAVLSHDDNDIDEQSGEDDSDEDDDAEETDAEDESAEGEDDADADKDDEVEAA